jgi:hypothetical protein
LNPEQQADIAGALRGGGSSRPNIIIQRLEVHGVFSDGDLATTLERRVLPELNDIWERNPGGVRSRTQDILATES